MEKVLLNLKVLLNYFLFRRKLPAPIDNANLFSYLTFGWLTKVVFKSRKPLVIEDLPPLSKYDAADHATKR